MIVFFWRDIVRIIGAWCKALVGKIPHSDPDAKMGWLIIIGSIPIAVLGLLLEDYIDTNFRSLWIVATTLVVFGLILAIADHYGKQQHTLDKLTVKHGIFYGLAQAMALIPGVLRSGGTITAGLLMGYTREAAARYSFLLAIPAVYASGLYKLVKSFARTRGVHPGADRCGYRSGLRCRLPDRGLVPEVRFQPLLQLFRLVPHPAGSGAIRRTGLGLDGSLKASFQDVRGTLHGHLLVKGNKPSPASLAVKGSNTSHLRKDVHKCTRGKTLRYLRWLVRHQHWNFSTPPPEPSR